MNNQIKDLRGKLEQRKGQREQLVESISKREDEIKSNQRNLLRHERALEIVKQVGLATQKQLEYHLSEQVSLAMEAVFDDPYQLVVNFVERRGKTEVDLLFSRGDLSFAPLGNSGGGAIDIAALGLRIAYWAMRQDKKVRPTLILDEPFSRLKGVDANRRALSIVREISRVLGIQIITVSDERIPRDDIIANADRVFLMSRNRDGVSRCEII